MRRRSPNVVHWAMAIASIPFAFFSLLAVSYATEHRRHFTRPEPA